MTGTPRVQVKARLISYFAERTGQVIHVESLADALDISVDQARTGVNNLRNSPSHESGGLDMKESVKVVARGNAWIYRPVNAGDTEPDKSNNKRIFEEIGNSRNGLVIQDVDTGTLYLATEL